MGKVASEHFQSIAEEIGREFELEKRVLSFSEYLALVEARPTELLRDAATYVRDMLDHFGDEEVDLPQGKVVRERVFDQGFLSPEDRAKDGLVGHESVHRELRRALSNFVREGRTNRVVLIHGPNGSAKSTIAACLMRGLEHYSETPGGALYRYHWVFPKKATVRGTIGFGGERSPGDRPGSFAHLPDEELEARVFVEVRDHPIFLFPPKQRRAYLEKVAPPGTKFPRYVTHGSLCHKSQQIFQALLAEYAGNLEEVLRHVQVERYFVSRRYRVGAVTLGPELSVDARERQVTADRSLGNLPLRLQSLSLYEVSGELVEASGGILELSDLLKRPIDAFKYLQMTAETGEVALSAQSLLVNAVFLASGNELHLAAFREHPEFESFRGRFDLIKVPYLRNYHQEAEIYRRHIRVSPTAHVAPHAIELAARFAVLSRLLKPQAAAYPDTFRDAVAKLTAWDKAELYSESRRRVLAGALDLGPIVAELYREWDEVPDYEGSFGASPREMRALLLDAAQSDRFPYLSPFAVLEKLDELCEKVSDYAFLRRSAQPLGYHDHEDARTRLYAWLLDRLDDEFRQSSGLVEEQRYEELLGRYFEQMSASLKREKLKNPLTGDLEEPDERLMSEVERLIGATGDAMTFRTTLLGRVAAWALENPGRRVVDSELFAEKLSRLRRSVFDEKKVSFARFLRAVASPDEVKESERRDGEVGLELLRARFGYEERSARDAAARLFAERYRNLL